MVPRVPSPRRTRHRCSRRFLEAQGVRDEGLAHRLADLCGGIPLSLKLAATLLAKDPDALRADGGSAFGTTLMHASDEALQGQLYGRVLDHIADERVRRLAHPGLVLRRITPEVILEVLDGPCELGLTTMAEAHALFDALRRETSLVTVDDTDEALVHRSDLRRVMLKLLGASEPALVERIRRAAIAILPSRSLDGGGRRRPSTTASTSANMSPLPCWRTARSIGASRAP